MVQSYEVSTKTSLAWNNLFLQQRKRGLDIKEIQLAFTARITLLNI